MAFTEVPKIKLSPADREELIESGQQAMANGNGNPQLADEVKGLLLQEKEAPQAEVSSSEV